MFSSCPLIYLYLCINDFFVIYLLLSFKVGSSKFDVLMRFEPVLAGADGDFEGAVEWEGFGHAFCKDFPEAVFFSGGGFEEEFIVYLKEHAALQFLFP